MPRRSRASARVSISMGIDLVRVPAHTAWKRSWAVSSPGFLSDRDQLVSQSRINTQ